MKKRSDKKEEDRTSKRVFPKIEVSQNGWFLVENLVEMDDLGGKPTIFRNTQTKTETHYRDRGWTLRCGELAQKTSNGSRSCQKKG